MKHTPEPWYVAHHQFFYAAGHLLVGQTACPPALSDDPVATQAINADRIVACVNACAGISEESLADDCWNKMRNDLKAANAELRAKNMELVRLPTQSEMAELVALRAKNAALMRAASIALGSLTGGMDGDWIGDDPIVVLREAITKAGESK